MKNTLIKRIEELGAEAAKLMQLRSRHEQAIQDIEVRLHQIGGAIAELDKLSKEEEGEAGTNSKQGNPGAGADADGNKITS